MIMDIDSLRGIDAYRAAAADLRQRLADLDAEAAGTPFTEAQRAEFEEISGAGGLLERINASIDELEIRESVVRGAVEAGGHRTETPVVAAPNVIRRPENIYDLAAYRRQVNSVDELPAAYREGAMRVLDQAVFPTADRAKAQENISRLLEDGPSREGGKVARRMIGTNSPLYKQAFARYVSGGEAGLTHEMRAALQTYTDADGGYAIPFTIDPTFVLTSNGAVNPMRQISRVESITTKEWQAVTTAGVTAAYAAETAAAADGAMTDVAGPTITPLRAHVFVPFTAEYAEDYGLAAIQSELGGLIQDAKDTLEATKFVMGAGTTEPDGIVAWLITDTTSLVTTITNDTYALDDIDKLETALPARFRANAAFVANRAILQKTRKFGDAGQPGFSIYDAMSKTLRGYPAYESTAMDDAATDAKEILLLGDFRYFVIVDRIGLSAEFVPQVFDGSGLPLGRRGVYARWRNNSKPLFANAFRLLKVQ